MSKRVVVLAPTKNIGYTEARAAGIEPVAVVTPRSPYAAHGKTADAVLELFGLTIEQRDALAAVTLPCLATRRTR